MVGVQADAARESETRIMALAGVGARVVNAGLVFLTQILFARMLGVAEYGVWASANTLLLLAAGFATFGLGATPQRFWPEYAATNDQARLRGLVRWSMVAPLALGALIALLAGFIVWLLGGWLGAPVVAATLVALIIVPAQASLDVVEGIALARAWKGLAYGVAFVLRPLLTPAIFLIAILLQVQPDAGLAMAAMALATWIVSLLLILLVWLKLRRELPPGPVVTEPRIWLAAALPVMLIDGAFMLMTSADVILLMLLRDDTDVGVYAAGARLVALVAFVHSGLTWASGHHFSALHQAGDRSGLAAYAARTTRWTFLPSVAAAVAVGLAAPLALMLFGKGFEGGGFITALLLFGLLARAAVGPAEQLLVMTDNQIAAAYAYAWAFVLNLALGLFLIPAWGGIGAAAATALSYAAAAAINAREVRLRLGFSVSILSVLRSGSAPAMHSRA